MQIEIVNIPVNEIIPYWRNPRRNDKTVDALVEVIQKNGFNVPIVVDKNNVVVKGHARLKAAKRLGMETVPCIVSDAPEDVIKADRISDNKIQELSAWDFGKLNFELAHHETPVFNRLFRPEESPVNTDEVSASVEGVGFTPTGLDAYDFGDGGVDEDAATATGSPYTGATEFSGDTGAAEYTPVVGGYEAAQDVPAQPVAEQAATGPRQCKTLCPYCGKVVMVTI